VEDLTERSQTILSVFTESDVIDFRNTFYFCNNTVNSDSKALHNPSTFSVIMRARPSQKYVSCAMFFDPLWLRLELF
jgi:hypothetical protein